jgi:hypothetical protein
LRELAFEIVDAEHGIYRRVRPSGSVMFIAIYVDDLPMAGSSLEEIVEVKALLAKRFRMKDLGPARRILGWELEYDRAAGVMTITQGGYVRSVLAEAGLSDCRAVGSPLDDGLASRIGTEEDLASADPSRSAAFMHRLGQWAYLAGTTRLDIAFTVNLLQRQGAAPTDAGWQILTRLGRYMRGTADAGLKYHGTDTTGGAHESLVGYTDSDWGGCALTGASTSSYVFTLFGGVVAWMVRRQEEIATSSTEAELWAKFYAVFEGLQQVRFVVQLLEPLGVGVTEPVPLYCDNQGAIKLAQSSKWSKRTKHVAIRVFSVRKFVRDRLIDVRWIPTADQLADLGTKGLPVARHRDLCRRLGMVGV